MELLSRYGLPEYWLIDPAGRSVDTYVNRKGPRLEAAGSFGTAESFTSPTLPGLRADVARLFED